jgi:hypothetical protein
MNHVRQVSSELFKPFAVSRAVNDTAKATRLFKHPRNMAICRQGEAAELPAMGAAHKVLKQAQS